MLRIGALALLALLASCTPPAEVAVTPPPTPVATESPAGDYVLDPMHSTLIFRVSHIGFSMYTAQFTDFDAALRLEPADPSRSSIQATVDVGSLSLPHPPPGFRDEVLGPNWLDAERFPQIEFRSTAVELTGANTARVTGDLTLRGVTRPIVLDATFNGGYAGHPLDPQARIGLSARGTFNRSDFGIAYGVPPPGSTMGVSDEVEVVIETEFSGPAWSQPQQAP